ncbi:hypothetical protein GE115_17705 [Agromyces sp. CFH 90414]|uniref:SIP-like Rossmann fold domain-containing protein n=1 Tax=Agromyces agglutinans TaxID=2662258 RepID=A0A6I2FM57_9MICO|nr:SIP domain-containing protein [Agromyces agglutinans]MRG61698.1 hypothetical protein [Agromyces agglutinans]
MASRMRKREPEAPRVLFAGDTGDLAVIRSKLEACPADAVGLVLIEACNALQIAPLGAPAGVGVHWVFRERASGVAPRGEALIAAVDHWLGEWMRPEGGVELDVWLGARGSSLVDAYARDLEREASARSAHSGTLQ